MSGVRAGAAEAVGRGVVVALSLGGWFFSQGLIGQRKPPGGTLSDGVHALTARLNAWLGRRRAWSNGVLIATSAMIDVLGIYVITAAVVGPTLRPFVGILVLFILRQACQAVVSLPEPAGMIWHRPPFPSLLVTYGVSTDLFFSGHTAIAVYGACEVARLGLPWLTALAVGIACLEAMAVLVLRAHYTMDVFAAVFAALFASSIGGFLAPPFDALVRGSVRVFGGA
jgi:hypothetical protein